MRGYKVREEAGSTSNTPASYAWYIAGLMFHWLMKHGGMAEMAKRNVAKAKLLYDFLDTGPEAVGNCRR